MDFRSWLLEKQPDIVERWATSVGEAYPAPVSRFLRTEKDRFMNPVGFHLRRELETLYRELLGDADHDRLAAALERLMKIWAVQNGPPSRAVGFLLILKSMIRDDMGGRIHEAGFDREFMDYASRIDRATLVALDLYTACREKVCEIRVSEAKAENERLRKLLIHALPELPDAGRGA